MSLKIIHLSDIHTHIEKNKNYLFDRSNALVGACCANINSSDNVIVVISGDLANTGCEHEYKQFNDFFTDIIRKIKEECNVSVDIVFVPGNHDCDFGSEQRRAERNQKINTLFPTCVANKAIEEDLLSVLSNYQRYENNYSLDVFAPLIKYKRFSYSCGTVVVYLLNTAWISQLHENPSQRFFPVEYLNDIDNINDDLVITVLHHPVHWNTPDNCSALMERIRHFSDLVIVGHEHKVDNYQMYGEDWSCVLCEGRELQNPLDNEKRSGFAIYEIDDGISTITTKYYSWNGNIFTNINSENTTRNFTKNARAIPNVYKPNADTKKWLEDIEINIHHSHVDNLILSTVFVWPNMDIIDYSSSEKDFGYGNRVTSNHFKTIISSQISLIIGETMCGKTAVAKEIYRLCTNDYNFNCLFIDAETISSYKPDGLQRIIDNAFKEQYFPSYLEEFQQLSRFHKVLIIDNFHNLKFNSEKKRKMFDYLCSKFNHIILFSNLDIDCSMMIADCNELGEKDIATFQILPFGNQKRKEFISKWYSIGRDEEETEEIERAVDSSIRLVDQILGENHGIIPAYPIYLFNILQSKDSSTNTFQMSQYGYLYSSLIQANLSRFFSPEQINIYEGALGHLAYYMLNNKKNSLTFSEINSEIMFYSKEMLVSIDTNEFIDSMANTKILKNKDQEYKFTYPYIYYFFVGKYISYHLNDKNVRSQIDYMCSHLYKEAYGNILIFVCYFANNETVIDSILINALSLFDYSVPYDFSHDNETLNDAYTSIDNALSKVNVGSNEVVEKNRNEQLETKDRYGINSGSVSDNIEIIDDRDEYSEQEKRINDLYSALKTMTVLGQIIKSYPGSINGTRKKEIIVSIHDLGMRTASETISILGMLEEDFIEYYIKRAKSQNKHSSSVQISQNIKSFYSSIMAHFVISMISIISKSFGGKNSIDAAKAALSNSISGNLVIHHMCMNYDKISADTIISYYKKLQQDNNYIAATTLKALTINYMRFNKCSTIDRNKLCDAFNVDKTKYLLGGL